MAKKVETPLRKPANLPYPRLPAPISPNIKEHAPPFFKYKIGSNLVYKQLNAIWIDTERPHKIHFKVIGLICRSQRNGNLGFYWIKCFFGEFALKNMYGRTCMEGLYVYVQVSVVALCNQNSKAQVVHVFILQAIPKFSNHF